MKSNRDTVMATKKLFYVAAWHTQVVPPPPSSGHVFFAFDSFMALVVLHPSYTTLNALDIVEFAGVPTNFKMTHGILFSSSG